MEGVGAIDDDVIALQQLHRIVFIDGRLDRVDLDIRVQSPNRPGGTVDLRPVQSRHRMDHLSLQVREPDMVVVGETDGAHAGGRQVERDRRAEGSDAHDQHARSQQPPLTGGPDFGKRQMTGVALSLFGRERGFGHQAPRGLAGTAWKMPWKTCGCERRKRRQSARVCDAKTSRAACSAFSVTSASTRLSPVSPPSGWPLLTPSPSRQAMTSSRRMSSGLRANTCPPCGPRVEWTRPARRSVISTWSRNGPGMAASSTMARTPYSVFIDKRIRTQVPSIVDRISQV